MPAARITKERATRIARAHACVRCGEYSYKRVVVREAPHAESAELGVAWHARLVCGVCGLDQELGIAADGEVVYDT